jgi:hypothetical protein
MATPRPAGSCAPAGHGPGEGTGLEGKRREGVAVWGAAFRMSAAGPIAGPKDEESRDRPRRAHARSKAGKRRGRGHPRRRRSSWIVHHQVPATRKPEATGQCRWSLRPDHGQNAVDYRPYSMSAISARRQFDSPSRTALWPRAERQPRGLPHRGYLGRVHAAAGRLLVKAAYRDHCRSALPFPIAVSTRRVTAEHRAPSKGNTSARQVVRSFSSSLRSIARARCTRVRTVAFEIWN